MSNSFRAIALSFILILNLSAQLRRVDGIDMQGPFLAQRGTTLPATCTQGQEFFKTDATAGQNKYLCTATNTWTQVIAAGTFAALGGQPTDNTNLSTALSGKAGKPSVAPGATTSTRYNPSTGLLEEIPGAAKDCVFKDGTSGACPSGSGSSNVVGGPGGKIAVNTVGTQQQVDTIGVPGLEDDNLFTGKNTFNKLFIPVVSALVTADCDESTEVGNFVFNNGASTGVKLYGCEQTGSGPATYGWIQQGGSGGVTDGDKGEVVVTGGVWNLDAGISASKVGLGSVVNQGTCNTTQAQAGAVDTCNMSALKTAQAIAAQVTPVPASVADIWRDSNSVVEDDFCGAGTASGTVGQLGWGLGVGAGLSGGQIVVDRNHPCVQFFGLPNTASTGFSTVFSSPNALNPYINLQSVAGWEIRTRIQFPSAFSLPNSEAGTTWYVGFGDNANTTPALPSNGFYAKFVTGSAAPWSFEAVKAGVADGSAQSSTAGNVAAGIWYTLRFRSVNAGEILFSVNAGSGFESEKAINVSSTANLTFFYGASASATTASLQRRMYLDSWKAIMSVVRY